MAELWPSSLPQYITRGSFTETPIDPRIRTETEYGPQKVRLRETKMRYIVNVSLQISATEYVTLKNYFEVTLGFGIKTFYFYHPQRQTNVEYRLTNLPSFSDLGGDHYVATWQMEEI